MKILLVSSFQPYWGSYPPDILDRSEGYTVGGGEENFLRCASELRARGHEVLAYHYGQAGVWNGVEFRTKGDPLYPVLVGEKWDAVAEWSNLRALEFAPLGAKRLFVQQLNDLLMPGEWKFVDCIVSPSHSHAEMVGGRWNWKGKRAVVHNGLIPEIYQPHHDYGDPPRWGPPPWAGRAMEVGYWSSPDRGLHILLEAWPKIRAEIPAAKLHVFYEINRYLSNAVNVIGPYGHRARHLRSLMNAAEMDKSITFHGAVPRLKLAEIQMRCRVMCYPYVPFDYCEGFCGSVNQGLAAGCTVITTLKDALPSLYGSAPYWLKGDDRAQGKFVDEVAKTTIAALRNELPEQQAKRAQGMATAYTWEKAGEQMEKACTGESWF